MTDQICPSCGVNLTDSHGRQITMGFVCPKKVKGQSCDREKKGNTNG